MSYYDAYTGTVYVPATTYVASSPAAYYGSSSYGSTAAAGYEPSYQTESYGVACISPSYEPTYSTPSYKPPQKPFKMVKPSNLHCDMVDLQSKKDWESMFERDFGDSVAYGRRKNRREPTHEDIDLASETYVPRAVSRRSKQVWSEPEVKKVVNDETKWGAVPGSGISNLIIRGLGGSSPQRITQNRMAEILPSKYGLEDDHDPTFRKRLRAPPAKRTTLSRLEGVGSKTIQGVGPVSTGASFLTDPSGHETTVGAAFEHLAPHSQPLVEKAGILGNVASAKVGLIMPPVGAALARRSTKKAIGRSIEECEDRANVTLKQSFKDVGRRMIGRGRNKGMNSRG